MPAELLERIAAGESPTLEFKTSFDKASIESLVAFANTQGGTVLVGVTDAAAIQGVTLGKETLNEWLGQIKSVSTRGRYYKRIASSNHALALNEIADLYLQFPANLLGRPHCAPSQPGRLVVRQNRTFYSAR